MTCKRFSTVTLSFKVGISFLLVALVLQAVGLSLPQWAYFYCTVIIGSNEDNEFSSVFRVGLWEECLCGQVFLFPECICVSKSALTGSFQAVQALEASGLACLIISGIFSAILLLSSENKRLKFINISFVLGAAVLIVTGCILYALDNLGENDHLLKTMEELFLDVEFEESRLDVSFFLCSIAGGLTLIVCPTLLVDYLTAKSVERPEQLHCMSSN